MHIHGSTWRPLKALEIWVRDGTPASEADRLATLDDDSDYQYDDHGNVLGGLRTPYVDAPAARLSGELNDGGAGCRLSGTTTLFDAATMASLYVDKAGYVSAVTEAFRSGRRARLSPAPRCGAHQGGSGIAVGCFKPVIRVLTAAVQEHLKGPLLWLNK